MRIWGGPEYLGYFQIGVLPLVYEVCYYSYYYDYYYCDEEWIVIPWIYGGKLYRLGDGNIFFNLGVGFPTLLALGVEFEI
jgi:hypothetical protein